MSKFLIPFFLLSLIYSCQTKTISKDKAISENSFDLRFCNCLEDKFSDLNKSLEDTLLQFEKFLIQHGALEDHSPQSYYGLIQRGKQDSAINIEIPIDTIFDIGQMFRIRSECYQLALDQNSRDTSNSLNFKIFGNGESYDFHTPVEIRMINYLNKFNVEMFESECFKNSFLYTLMMTISYTEGIPERLKPSDLD